MSKKNITTVTTERDSGELSTFDKILVRVSFTLVFLGLALWAISLFFQPLHPGQ